MMSAVLGAAGVVVEVVEVVVPSVDLGLAVLDPSQLEADWTIWFVMSCLLSRVA